MTQIYAFMDFIYGLAGMGIKHHDVLLVLWAVSAFVLLNLQRMLGLISTNPRLYFAYVVTIWAANFYVYSVNSWGRFLLMLLVATLTSAAVGVHSAIKAQKEEQLILKELIGVV